MEKTNFYETGIGYFVECSQERCTHLLFKESIRESDIIVAECVGSKYSDVKEYRCIVYASPEAESRHMYLGGMITRKSVEFYWANWIPVKQYVPESPTIDEIKEQLTF